MIALILTALISQANAAEPAKTEFTTKAPVMTKREAVKAFFANEQAVIYRCTQVVLNDKMSIVNKKKKAK